MNHDWHTELKSRGRAPAMFLPPALVDETAWDILLALHSDKGCEPSLDKLCSVVSAPPPVLSQWLALLEEQQLITGKTLGFSEELRAVLTPAGCRLLDRFLAVTSDLQIGSTTDFRGDCAG